MSTRSKRKTTVSPEQVKAPQRAKSASKKNHRQNKHKNKK